MAVPFDQDRWRVVSPYLEEALAFEDEEARRSWLRALETTDPEIATEVQELLDEHRALTAAHFLEECPVVVPLQPSIVAGQIMGGYTLLSPIGQGGMGTVWLAERSDGRFERRAAVKFLAVVLGDQQGEQRFRREGVILARLTHPNIAQLFDAGVTPTGQPYLVLEYVDGQPIDEYCDRRGLDIRSRVALVLDVLGAVSHAHANLTVHRDLKPSNILVDRSGVAKLLDFGIARIVDVAAGAAQTRERSFTPAYASPEQIRGRAPATTSDIYSLGAVLYRLLTGRPPHEVGSSANGIEEAICSVDPPPPRRLNPAVPLDLDCIVRKALRKEPGERYGSADAFGNDLRSFLESRPVAARSGSGWYRTRKFLRRYWVPVAATLVVIGSLAGGLYAANRERATANRRFSELRQLAGRVIEMDRQIRFLPGSRDARQRLVSITLTYLQGLESDARGDVDLMRELADGYMNIARMQGVPVEPNLGQSAAADASLVRAEALLSAILAKRPSDHGSLLRVAVVAHDRMVIAQTEGRNDEALKYARMAGDRLARFLSAGTPTSPESVQVAGLYSNIALGLVNLHRYDEAIPYAERCIQISRSVPAVRSRLPGGLSVLATARRDEGDLDGALKAISEARVIDEQIPYQSPTQQMLNQYGVLFREGMILGEVGGISLGRSADAIEPLQKAFDITEAAARADANDVTSRVRLGESGRELGNVLRDRDPGRALTVYDVAIARLREAHNNVNARRNEAMALAESAYALRRLGRAAEAAQRVQAALAILAATKDYPKASIPLDSAACAVARANADQQAAQGDLGSAVRTYLGLIDAVTASSSNPAGDLSDAVALSRLEQALGELYQRSGDRTAAEAVANRRLELWRQWERKLPANPLVLRQLASVGD